MKLSSYHQALRKDILPEDVQAYANGTSASRIAEQRGISLNTTLRHLRSAQQSIRPAGVRPAVDLDLTPRFHEITDGLMLGDGSINKAGSVRLTQCIAHRQWVFEVKSMLRMSGLDCGITPLPPKSTKSKTFGRTVHSNGGLMLYSQICRQTKQERSRWYPHGKKLVPRDVVMSRLSVALWFCGDGAFGTNGTLRFCTQGFSSTDVNFLISLMRDIIDIHAYLAKSVDGPIIKIDRRDDAVRLTEFMQPYVSPCFEYKLRHVRPRAPDYFRKLTAEQAVYARKEFANGTTKAELARTLGVTKQSMGRLLAGTTYRDVV